MRDRWDPVRLGALAAATLGLLALLAIWQAGPSLAPSPAESPASPVAAGADAFRAEFLPRLRRANVAASALVELGETHERNLLLIHTRQDAMLAALADADAWLASHQPSPAQAPAIAAYQQGAAGIRAAMEEAQAGFLHLDFGEVARATVTLRQGAASLARAEALLDE